MVEIDSNLDLSKIGDLTEADKHKDVPIIKKSTKKQIIKEPNYVTNTTDTTDSIVLSNIDTNTVDIVETILPAVKSLSMVRINTIPTEIKVNNLKLSLITGEGYINNIRK